MDINIEMLKTGFDASVKDLARRMVSECAIGRCSECEHKVICDSYDVNGEFYPKWCTVQQVEVAIIEYVEQNTIKELKDSAIFKTEPATITFVMSLILKSKSYEDYCNVRMCSSCELSRLQGYATPVTNIYGCELLYNFVRENAKIEETDQ